MSPSNISSTCAVTGSTQRYINGNNVSSSTTYKNSQKGEAKALASARMKDFIDSSEYSSLYIGNTKHRTMWTSRQSMATKIQAFNSAFNTNATFNSDTSSTT
ncbi:hypothetical protein B0J14DRAFT_646944 [Halenospora varia]|nr:hypothetical protein B0J14DRAFT_646944 [Halenospora varia]